MTVGRSHGQHNVNMLLYKYGFGHRKVLVIQQCFFTIFKQKLSGCFAQDWHHDIIASHKLNYYAHFKHTLEPERYLHILQVRKHIIAFAKLRCASHNLDIGKADMITSQKKNIYIYFL